jgi:hypothetical protein
VRRVAKEPSYVNNISLVQLNVNDNQLTELNVKNGNNTNFTTYNSLNNPNLLCVR